MRVCVWVWGVFVGVCVCGCGMLICFVSALGSHETGRHKLHIIIIIKWDNHSTLKECTSTLAQNRVFKHKLNNSLQEYTYLLYMLLCSLAANLVRFVAIYKFRLKINHQQRERKRDTTTACTIPMTADANRNHNEP